MILYRWIVLVIGGGRWNWESTSSEHENVEAFSPIFIYRQFKAIQGSLIINLQNSLERAVQLNRSPTSAQYLQSRLVKIADCYLESIVCTSAEAACAVRRPNAGIPM